MLDECGLSLGGKDGKDMKMILLVCCKFIYLMKYFLKNKNNHFGIKEWLNLELEVKQKTKF